ncbi:MAG: DNA-3-methyladenine glycosylase I [Faecalibacillus sp.]
MNKNRCCWVSDDPVYIDYHDNEWGKPVYDDKKLYEMFLLETFQAGLSWITILHKRKYFREAFDQFDVYKIAHYDDEKIKELLNNKNIIRNRRKILAAIKNAGIFIKIQKEFGSFSHYIWSFTDNQIIYLKDNEQVVQNELSDTISKDLKKRGMSFVGSVTIYSYLEAIGVINNHQLQCYLHKK